LIWLIHQCEISVKAC